ncbi:MAG: nuclear transport factor 2 family protein [Solirubrobacteraceae bacterium]
MIRRWAAALRAGRISKATSAFALPVVVSNSGPPITLRSADEVAVFNITLPCGARVVRVLDVGRYVTATFELTARRGPGAGCGAGVGQRAYTAFLIRNGRIAAWRRVGAPDGRPSRGAPRLPGRTPPPGTQAA